jgi:two-component system, NtrC family, nitrogen regulation sensor histidine kinase NtrY
MVFNDFKARVAWRILLIAISQSLLIYMLFQPTMYLAAGIVFFILIIQLFELYRYASQTNRKLTRFLESVKYSDFVSGFSYDDKLGKSFRELNKAFNEVLEAFRKARSEKEEHWLYLNTIVQQVNTGLISFDDEGQIHLINPIARKYLGINQINNIEELKTSNSSLYHNLKEVEPGKSILHKGKFDIQLNLQATEIRIRGNVYKLLTLQNISPELQKQEITAWQNLSRVLRHEIMNSITPISSLTSTLKDILTHDLVQKNNHFEIGKENTEDLREGLNTIESRSKGLIKFIDAYRDYTSLPKPNPVQVKLKDLMAKVSGLMQNDIKKRNINFISICKPENLVILADEELIEQVLINLIKNAIEALHDTADATITFKSEIDANGILVSVEDNGPGIIREAIDQIFIPFYSTKRTGSGIGLSLSRQIMQMHNGSLSVSSEPDVRTVFTLRF